MALSLSLVVVLVVGWGAPPCLGAIASTSVSAMADCSDLDFRDPAHTLFSLQSANLKATLFHPCVRANNSALAFADVELESSPVSTLFSSCVTAAAASVLEGNDVEVTVLQMATAAQSQGNLLAFVLSVNDVVVDATNVVDTTLSTFGMAALATFSPAATYNADLETDSHFHVHSCFVLDTLEEMTAESSTSVAINANATTVAVAVDQSLFLLRSVAGGAWREGLWDGATGGCVVRGPSRQSGGVVLGGVLVDTLQFSTEGSLLKISTLNTITQSATTGPYDCMDITDVHPHMLATQLKFDSNVDGLPYTPEQLVTAYLSSAVSPNITVVTTNTTADVSLLMVAVDDAEHLDSSSRALLRPGALSQFATNRFGAAPGSVTRANACVEDNSSDNAIEAGTRENLAMRVEVVLDLDVDVGLGELTVVVENHLAGFNINLEREGEVFGLEVKLQLTQAMQVKQLMETLLTAVAASTSLGSVGNSSITTAFICDADLISGQSKITWHSALETNFVMVLDLDRVEALASGGAAPCQPTNDEATSPVVLFRPTFLSDTFASSFGPTSNSLLYSKGGDLIGTNADALAHPQTTSQVVDALLADASTCTLSGVVQDNTTCEDSATFMDQQGHDCEFWEEQFARNEECGDASMSDDDRAMIYAACPVACGLCARRVDQYCESYLQWTCSDCLETLGDVLERDQCGDYSCFFEAQDGDTVMNMCFALCEDEVTACGSTQAALCGDLSQSQFAVSEICDGAPLRFAESISSVFEESDVTSMLWQVQRLVVGYDSGEIFIFLDSDNRTIASVIEANEMGSVDSDVTLSISTPVLGLVGSQDGLLVAATTQDGTGSASLRVVEATTGTILRRLLVESTDSHSIAFGRPVSAVWALVMVSPGKTPNEHTTASNSTFVDFTVSFSWEQSDIGNTSVRVTNGIGEEVDVVRLWRVAVPGFKFTFSLDLEGLSDGPFSLQIGTDQRHVHFLDRQKPTVQIHGPSNAPSAAATDCDSTVNTAIAALNVTVSERVEGLCIGPVDGDVVVKISTALPETVLLQGTEASTMETNECEFQSCGADGSQCTLLVATTCSECTVFLSIPPVSSDDLAGNPNEASNNFSLCFDTVDPLVSFEVESQALDLTTAAYLSVPFTLTIHFDEPVSGLSLSDLFCDTDEDQCELTEFTTINQTSVSVAVSPNTLSTFVVGVAASAVVDVAGNLNARTALSVVPDTEVRFLSSSSFVAAVVVDCLVVLLVALSSLVVHRCRTSPVIRASTPLFSQFILLSLVLNVVANVSYGVSLSDYSDTTRDASCQATIHLTVYAAALMLGTLVARNFRVWRVVDNPSLKVVRISTSSLVKSVGALLGLCATLLASWSGVHGAHSSPNTAHNPPFVDCSPRDWRLLYAAGSVLGTAYVVGIFLISRIYNRSNMLFDSRFNETKVIAFTSYNILFVAVVWWLVEGTTSSADSKFALTSFVQLYYVLCVLIVMFWVTKFRFLYRPEPEAMSSKQFSAASVKKPEATSVELSAAGGK